MVSAAVRIPIGVGPPRSKHAIDFANSSRVPTWSSSRPAWAAVREPARHRSWPRSHAKSAHSRSASSRSPSPSRVVIRMKHAGHGIEELHSVVDTLITIPNQRLLALAGKGTAVRDAFSIADQVLLECRPRHLGPDHHSRPHQSRLRGRSHRDERGGCRSDGNRRSAIGDTRAIDAAGAAISSPLARGLVDRGRTRRA